MNRRPMMRFLATTAAVLSVLVTSSDAGGMAGAVGLAGDGDRENEAVCDALCGELRGSADPATACKAFARALPHPKMGRTCNLKFLNGFAFACPLMCSR